MLAPSELGKMLVAHWLGGIVANQSPLIESHRAQLQAESSNLNVSTLPKA